MSEQCGTNNVLWVDLFFHKYSLWVLSKNHPIIEMAWWRNTWQITDSLRWQITLYTLFMFHQHFVNLSMFYHCSQMVYREVIACYTLFANKDKNIFLGKKFLICRSQLAKQQTTFYTLFVLLSFEIIQGEQQMSELFWPIIVNLKKHVR